MPDEIYIVMERRGNGETALTPYLSEESARQHYEETLAVYSDIRKPFYPIFENEDRTRFVYKVNGELCMECSYQKEEVYA